MSFFGAIRKGLVIAGKDVGKVALKAGEDAAPIVIPLVTHGVVSSVEVTDLIKGVHSLGGLNMNPLEQMAIMMILGIIQTTVKNPASKTAAENQLLGVADDIYLAYGLTPPARPTAAAV